MMELENLRNRAASLIFSEAAMCLSETQFGSALQMADIYSTREDKGKLQWVCLSTNSSQIYNAAKKAFISMSIAFNHMLSGKETEEDKKVISILENSIPKSKDIKNTIDLMKEDPETYPYGYFPILSFSQKDLEELCNTHLHNDGSIMENVALSRSNTAAIVYNADEYYKDTVYDYAFNLKFAYELLLYAHWKKNKKEVGELLDYGIYLRRYETIFPGAYKVLNRSGFTNIYYNSAENDGEKEEIIKKYKFNPHTISGNDAPNGKDLSWYPPSVVASAYAVAGVEFQIGNEKIPESDEEMLSDIIGEVFDYVRTHGSSTRVAEKIVGYVSKFVYAAYFQSKAFAKEKDDICRQKTTTIEKEKIVEIKVSEKNGSSDEDLLKEREANKNLKQKNQDLKERLQNKEEELRKARLEVEDLKAKLDAIEVVEEEEEQIFETIEEDDEKEDSSEAVLKIAEKINQVTKNHSVIVAGAAVKLVKKLQPLNPDVRFLFGDGLTTNSDMLKMADVVIVHPKHMSHKLFYQVKSLAPDYEILYSKGINVFAIEIGIAQALERKGLLVLEEEPEMEIEEE